MNHCDVCNRVTHHLLNNCTSHSKYPSQTKRMLALIVDFKRTSSSEIDLPAYVPPMPKSPISNRPILKRIINKYEDKNTVSRCVGCNVPVTPGMVHTGSVIAGIITLEQETTTPVVGFMMVIEEIIILGGEQVTKRIQVMKRIKGFICESCASNYSTVKRVRRDGSIEYHPVVKTDPLPGVIRTTLAGVEEPAGPRRSRPAFNTRYTQGRKGKRI